MSNKSIIVWLWSFLLLLASGNLSATRIDRVTLDEAIRDAGLIFQGTVTKIESHTLAELGPNYQRDPHAFVTFRIERIFKGEVERNETTITLPFELCFTGNFEKQPAMTEQLREGMACMISGMPSFVVGESDILFTWKVLPGGSSPLLGWWQGRYSIVNNKIYPVAWLTQEGGIDFTAPYCLEDEQEAEKRGQALPQEAKKQGWTPPKGGKRMGPDEFSKVIKRKLRSLEQTQFMAGKPKLEPVKSFSFSDPFYRNLAELKYEEEQKRKTRLLKMYPNGIPQGE